jgi:quercetin dioxygenase-like cupin family protein
MLNKPDPTAFRDMAEGVRLNTRAHGERTLLAEIRFDRGAVVPVHQHQHEQTGYLVSGRLALEVAGERHVADPGDAWCIAGGVEHGGEALEDTVIVEVFSPVREDYLP